MKIYHWWQACRPKTLIVSIAPVALGVCLATHDGYFNLTSMGGFQYDQVALINIIPEPYTEPPALFEFEIFDNDVLFIDLSSEINETTLIEWEWNFGDGTSEVNSFGFCDHTYDTPGTYMSQLTVTNEYGQTGPSHFEQIIIQGSTLGDINNDSTINVLDIVLVVNFIIGSGSPTNQEFYAADVNQDSLLNVLDVVILVNLVLNN